MGLTSAVQGAIFKQESELKQCLSAITNQLTFDNLQQKGKMYKYLLQSVEGIQWFGIITLLLFFGTFCFAAIRAFISRKEEMQHMANLPLED